MLGYVAVFLRLCFNDTATTEIYTLSLHDALPISAGEAASGAGGARGEARRSVQAPRGILRRLESDQADIRQKAIAMTKLKRSEEHTSELQSRQYLVCRLLLEKKNSRHIFTLYYAL